ncbi:MAG TPA: NAD-dependent protein deacetylase [Longimicrobiales bacterium]
MTDALLSSSAALEAVLDVLRGRRLVALAGAGCSTESGIPDYRGPEGSLRTRKPIQYQEFIRGESARVRYWARSTVGWPRMAAARPNPGHNALARLEEAGRVRGIITQNVDGLHHAAGSRRVVELHGSLAQVRCLSCAEAVSREHWQATLAAANPAFTRWLAGVAGGVETAPDGDAELPAHALEGFVVPACDACGGIMKPDVVFFGENVPRRRVDEAWRLFGEGEVLLVVGSSLTVYSGRRFVDRARADGVPVVVLNVGPTRADECAAAKLEGRLGVVLPTIAGRLMHQ